MRTARGILGSAATDTAGAVWASFRRWGPAGAGASAPRSHGGDLSAPTSALYASSRAGEVRRGDTKRYSRPLHRVDGFAPRTPTGGRCVRGRGAATRSASRTARDRIAGRARSPRAGLLVLDRGSAGDKCRDNSGHDLGDESRCRLHTGRMRGPWGLRGSRPPRPALRRAPSEGEPALGYSASSKTPLPAGWYRFHPDPGLGHDSPFSVVASGRRGVRDWGHERW